MRNQWCNTRRERPSCTSKPWQDTWEPKGRTQQVSSWPGSACSLGPSRPGTGVCPTAHSSLWHSSDTNGWGVSHPHFDASNFTARSQSWHLVGAVDPWKIQVLVFVFVVKLCLRGPVCSLSVVSSHFTPPYSLTPSSSPNKFIRCCERPRVWFPLDVRSWGNTYSAWNM